MKKLIALICIAITVVMAVALTIVLILGMNGRQIFGWRSGNVRVDFFNIDGRAELVKEDSVTLGDVQSMEFLSDRSTMYIRATDSDRMTVRQYSSSDLRQDEIFDLRKSGSRVTLDAKRQRARIGIFVFFPEEYIEVDVPRNWLGNVDIRSSSGGVRIQDSFEWGDINIRCSSGGISTERELKGNTIDITVSSGGVNLKDNIIGDRVFLKSTSGGIKTEGITAGTVDLSCSSGGITIRGTIKADDVNMKTTSGGAGTQLIDAGKFNIESSSGGIKITELRGQGYMRCTSGGIRVDYLIPTGSVELRASSGGIRVDVPRELRHYVSTNTSSGSATVNER